jgi:hypothetical protein
VSKSKHIQFVSGADMSVYWISNFVWDFAVFVVPAIAVVIVFACFNVPGMYTKLWLYSLPYSDMPSLRHRQQPRCCVPYYHAVRLAGPSPDLRLYVPVQHSERSLCKVLHGIALVFLFSDAILYYYYFFLRFLLIIACLVILGSDPFHF